MTTTDNLRALMAKLPHECTNLILSYSYNTQPDALMDEVRACALKRKIMNEWYAHVCEYYNDYRHLHINMFLYNNIKLFFQKTPPPMDDRVFQIYRALMDELENKTVIHRFCVRLFTLSELLEIIEEFDYYVALAWAIRADGPPPAWMRGAGGDDLAPKYMELLRQRMPRLFGAPSTAQN